MVKLNNNQKMLISLLSAGIHKEKIEIEYLLEVQWEQLLDEALRHQVTTLIYQPMADFGEKLGVPEKLLKVLRNNTLQEGMLQERNYISLEKVLNDFVAAGIPLIVLKGLVLRELYPEPGLRTMADFDFLVKPADMGSAYKVLERAGYKVETDQDKHAAFTHKVFPTIEVHRSMAPIGIFENYDSFEEHAWKYAMPINVSGVQVLSLEPTDKLVYLVIHMASHIISSGFGLRQLCDFVLFIEAHRDKVEWSKFYSFIKSLQLETFTNAVFEVCHKMFDLKFPSGCNMTGNNAALAANDLMIDIMDAGIFGLDDKDRITANRMLHYSGGSEAKSFGSKLHIFANLLFPGADKLDVRFEYARSHHILLPAAWIHRLFYNFFRNDIDFSEKTAVLAPATPTRIYNNRSSLLKELGLNDKQSGGTL